MIRASHLGAIAERPQVVKKQAATVSLGYRLFSRKNRLEAH